MIRGALSALARWMICLMVSEASVCAVEVMVGSFRQVQAEEGPVVVGEVADHRFGLGAGDWLLVGGA